MGGWVSVSINILVIYSFYRLGNTTLIVVSAINAVIGFWSFRVMHNYGSFAMRSKANRLEENLKAENRLDDESVNKLNELRTKIDINAVPDWITDINLGSFVITVIMLITFVVQIISR